MFEMLKKSSRTRDRFTTVSDLQNNEEHVSVLPGIRQLSGKLKVYSPEVPKIFPG